MLFYSIQFYIFLPIVFIIYWGILRNRAAKLCFLTFASYVFYMSWNAKLIILLVGSTVIDYFAVIGMNRTQSSVGRRSWLALSLVFNLGMLAVFKYANFLLQNAVILAGILGWKFAISHFDIVLPLGISFYTFETISYTIDCYYRKTEPFSSLRDYAFFISFFPHLIAGPIIRPRQMLPQIKILRDLRDGDILVGFGYFLIGLVKKVVVAGQLSIFADQIFQAPQSYAAGTLWVGVTAYAMQIYCDFSGYTDMAIGLARLFGFDLPMNFRTPYLARNVAEFWKRWHITLSSWLRDYLYIPLRSLNDSEWNVYASLFLTMFLGGLWHGANWTFVIWGAYHGALLMIHRISHQKLGWFWKPTASLVPAALRGISSRVFTFFLICVGWVFFRAQTLPMALSMLRQMFSRSGHVANTLIPGHVLLLIALVLGYDLTVYFGELHNLNYEFRFVRSARPMQVAAMAVALFLMLVFAPNNLRPFIYFQF